MYTHDRLHDEAIKELQVQVEELRKRMRYAEASLDFESFQNRVWQCLKNFKTKGWLR